MSIRLALIMLTAFILALKSEYAGCQTLYKTYIGTTNQLTVTKGNVFVQNQNNYFAPPKKIPDSDNVLIMPHQDTMLIAFPLWDYWTSVFAIFPSNSTTPNIDPVSVDGLNMPIHTRIRMKYKGKYIDAQLGILDGVHVSIISKMYFTMPLVKLRPEFVIFGEFTNPDRWYVTDWNRVWPYRAEE